MIDFKIVCLHKFYSTIFLHQRNLYLQSYSKCKGRKLVLLFGPTHFSCEFGFTGK